MVGICTSVLASLSPLFAAALVKMLHKLLTTALLSLLASNAQAASFNRAACQSPTRNPLTGCPRNTLLVGPTANFTSVQQAVLSIPNNTQPYYILVLPGNYTEQVNVTRRAPLTLLGQTSSPNDAGKNTANVIWHDATGNTVHSYDNAYTSTLTVAPDFNASATGSGTTGSTYPFEQTP
jgi:pectin methylesterase-like acyl-CoA thioesterase